MIRELEGVFKGRVRYCALRPAMAKKALDKATRQDLEKLTGELRVGILQFKICMDELVKRDLTLGEMVQQFELLDERADRLKERMAEIVQVHAALETKSED